MRTTSLFTLFRPLIGLMVLLAFSPDSWGRNIVSHAAFGATPKGGFEAPSVGYGQFRYWNPSTPSMFAATGYTFTNGTGLTNNRSGFTGANPNAPQGSQVVFIQGSNAYIEHQFTLSQNGYYRFLVKAALRNRPSERKHLRIYIDNVVVGEFVVTATNYEDKISLPLFLNSGSHRVRIQGVNPIPGDHTVFVDDVRLQRIRDWRDGSSWQGGVVPGPNDHAIVSSNAVLGISGVVQVRSIRADGQLLVAQNRNLDLYCKYLLVQGGAGLLQIGQKLAPYYGTATITLNASRADLNNGDPTVQVMGMGTKFVGAMGGSRIELHGAPKTSWERLRVNAPAGSNSIQVPAVNWKVGDQIVIAPSRNNWQEAEVRSITAIQDLAGGVKRLTLHAPLGAPHTGVIKTYSKPGRTWTADLRAEVGMLTHNIKIQGNANSEADNGFGAHTMIMMNSRAYVSNVELYRVGQKSLMGRYPFHWHLLANAGAGQYLENSSIHKSWNRAITIHGTHSTRVDQNVCYDHIGHGVFLEDGAEENNIIQSNFVLHTKKPAPGQQLTPSEDPLRFSVIQNQTPSSFWITNPKNQFSNNVAAGTPGTGYWFAFPKSPIGESAGDARFAGIQPYKNPLLLFRGNRAHSCQNGFDAFDQLNGAHDILTNLGWEHNGQHLIEDCLWYSNKLALYTGIGVGGPSDNLIFRNNVFVENEKATMFASYLIVARSGENLVPPYLEVAAYLVYDGAGQIHNSHFIGWNHPKSNLFNSIGAAIKHPNHRFLGNTTDAGVPRISLQNVDLPPAYNVKANDLQHPRKWSFVIRDLNGAIGGKANTSIICNHPFVRTGNEITHPHWVNTYRSDHKFVLSLVYYPGLTPINFPNVTVTRSGNNAPEASVFYIGDGPNTFKEHQQLPFIVNQDFTYTYAYESLPSNRRVRMRMDDAEVGDDYIAVFKDFARLGGLNVQSTQGYLPRYSSYNSLRNATRSAYYLDGNDLYLKAVATSKQQEFTLTWSNNGSYPNAKLDTDGDYMADGEELAQGRNPFHAKDLAFEFNATNNFEGWRLGNIGSGNVTVGSLNGIANTPNGDAQIFNTNFNFKASEVVTIRVRMKASHNTGIHLFFGSDLGRGFSGTRLVGANYTGNGNWQVLTFNVSAHPDWRSRITDLRIDPVTQQNRSFNIDWIRADAAIPKSLSNLLDFDKTPPVDLDDKPEADATAPVVLFPNPVGDQLNVQGPVSNATFQIIDLNGRVVKTGQLQEQAIDVKALAPGSYWLKLQERSYPFVKQ